MYGTGKGAPSLATHELEVEFVASSAVAGQGTEPFIVTFNRSSLRREVWGERSNLI